jgi:hypothetical protein
VRERKKEERDGCSVSACGLRFFAFVGDCSWFLMAIWWKIQLQIPVPQQYPFFQFFFSSVLSLFFFFPSVF